MLTSRLRIMQPTLRAVVRSERVRAAVPITVRAILSDVRQVESFVNFHASRNGVARLEAIATRGSELGNVRTRVTLYLRHVERAGAQRTQLIQEAVNALGHDVAHVVDDVEGWL